MWSVRMFEVFVALVTCVELLSSVPLHVFLQIAKYAKDSLHW